jgi:hypothetical protein
MTSREEVLADLRSHGWTVVILCSRHVAETKDGWALPEMTMFESEADADGPCDLCKRRPTSWARLVDDKEDEE